MSTQPNVKQLKPGTNNQILLTTGGVVVWGNPLATSSALGEVQLASQTQAFAGTPDVSGSNPLVVQPSGMLIRRNQTAGHAEIFLMSASNSAVSPPTIASTNARGQLALDLQTEIVNATEIASGQRSITIGTRNTASAYGSICIGRLNTNAGTTSIVIGTSNTQSSTSQNNHVFGTSNTITGTGSTANNIVQGAFNTLSGGQNNSIVGSSNQINSSSGKNFAVGANNILTSSAYQSGAFGYNNIGVGSNSIIVGLSNNGNNSAVSAIFGSSNAITSTSSTNAIFGLSNNIQNLNANPNSVTACGTSNTINSVVTSAAFGHNNNIQGLTGETGNFAFGSGNTIHNGSSSNTLVGLNNAIGNNTTRSYAFGENNSITSIAYGNGGGIACAVGTNNTIANGELVYLFGHGNESRSDSFNTVFADNLIAVGIGNVATETAHSASLFGINNVISGLSSTAVGNGNTTGTGTTNSFFGFGNNIATSNAANCVLLGNGNQVGGSTANDGDNSVIVGRSNHCLSGSNVFGQFNFNSFNIFATGNAYNTNCFGTSNFAGGANTNCDFFGTDNAIGQTGGLIGSPSPDLSMAIGRNNTIYSDQVFAVGYGNYSVLSNENSMLVGFSNSLPSNCTNSVMVGANNSVLTSTSVSNSVFGYKNVIGGPSLTAKFATAAGYANTAGSDNSIAIGLGNYAGYNAASSIAIGIINNNDRSFAFLNDTTGAITLNAFPSGGPVKNTTIGINSVAVGSENNTSGLNSVAFGRHNDASATEAVALGVRCVASAAGAVALGDRAIARVANTVNISGLPIIRKDNGESAGTEFLSFAGSQAIIQSKLVDLTVSQIYPILLPVGPRFWTDEVGIEVVSNTTGSVTQDPYCSWGTVTNFPNSLVGQAIKMTSGVSINQTRSILTWNSATGEITFTAFTSVSPGDTFIIVGSTASFSITSVTNNGDITSIGLIQASTYTQKYRLIAQMTGLAGVPGNREVFSTFENDFGETSDTVAGSHTVSLAARIEIGATISGGGTYMGRFYWKGRFVEQ